MGCTHDQQAIEAVSDLARGQRRSCCCSQLNPGAASGIRVGLTVTHLGGSPRRLSRQETPVSGRDGAGVGSARSRFLTGN